MKLPYRLFQRSNGMYFIEDRFTKRQASLRTKDKRTAARITRGSTVFVLAASTMNFTTPPL